MSSTKRSTRSNSNTSDKSNDIPTMLVKMKQEIIESTKSEIKNVVDKLSRLEYKIAALDDALDRITSRQQEQEREIANLTVKFENLRGNASADDLLEELQLRLVRNKNVIISGLPEQTEGSVDERRTKDEDVVERLFEKIDMADVDIRKVSRLGKITQDRGRLVRVVFSEEEEKTKALRKAKLLHTFDEYRRVYLNPDRTPSQQKKFAILRHELKVRKEIGEDVVIFRDKVLTRKDVNAVQNFRKGF